MPMSKYLWGLLILFLLFSCHSSTFESFGEFSIKKLSNGIKEITDGVGRKFVLVPKGIKAPKQYTKDKIIYIPVKRVIAYSGYNVSLLRGLGVLNTLVGVTHKKDYWTIDYVKHGLEKGSIIYVGESNAIDYELIKKASPEVVFTWNLADIPKLEEMGIKCIVTTTKSAMDLNTRMKFMLFLSQFFNKEDMGEEFVKKVKKTIKDINTKLKHISSKPKVIWGDIYEKRVLIEPGDSWSAQIVEISGGDYLFSDIRGSS